MATKLTKQDRKILAALPTCEARAPGLIAVTAGIRSSSPRETAARHLIKLTKLGLAEKVGSRMYPRWKATDAGLSALKEQEKGE